MTLIVSILALGGVFTGLALLIWVSLEARAVIKHVDTARALAGLPPHPVRHFVDFANISQDYVNETGRQFRILRIHLATALAGTLFCAGGLVLLWTLRLVPS